MCEKKGCEVSNEEDKKVFKLIHENYKNMNCMMAEEMDIASLHGVITGDYREQMWMNFFRSIIPKKFSMSQGVLIIDSFGKVSKEVDIAVYDEQYTPYVFQYNTLKFIPIEAVAVVIECKSKSPDENSLNGWIERIEQLLPNPSGITRIVSGYSCAITNKSQLKTRPIKILATIKGCGDKAIETMEKEYCNKFDFIIVKNKKDKKFNLKTNNEHKSLGWWAKELNGVGNENYLEIVCEKGGRLPNESEEFLKKEENKKLQDYIMNELLIIENEDKKIKVVKKLDDLRIPNNPLLTLNFQLNQLLMLINNPMPFPHFAYAKRFREIIEEMNNKTNEDKKKKS